VIISCRLWWERVRDLEDRRVPILKEHTGQGWRRMATGAKTAEHDRASAALCCRL